MSRPDCIQNVSALKPEPYERKAAGIAGVVRDIGAAIGTRLIGVDVTDIPPGKKSSYSHHHKNKEEFFFVLSGRCRVNLGDESYELNPGDAVSRPAGTGIHHQFENPYQEPCSVLMLGVMAGKGLEDVIEWPDLKRMLSIDAEGNRSIRRMGS